MQALVSIILMVPMLILNLKSDEPAMFTFMGLALIISGLLTFLICWKGLKVIEFPETFSCSDINWKWAMVAVIASIMGVFAGDLLSEIANLPNVIEDMILGMATNIWGILSVAVIGPVVEELVFREGVCGYLIRNGSSPWRAIWISAILFGIIHFNPAQIPFAILMGVILGVIYVKTGNIVVTSIIHILNNSFAVVQMKVLGEEAKDFKMVDWVGGYTIAGICIIIGFAGCFYLLRKMWERTGGEAV